MTPVQQIEALLNAIEAHDSLKQSTLSLIPTENQMSLTARSALSSDLAQRYLLLDSTVWEYPQLEHLKAIEDRCAALVAALFDVTQVNVRPLSGINALLILLAAMSDTGQTLYAVSPNSGGHGATETIARRLGLTLRHVPFDTEQLDFDLEATARAFRKERPNIIYLDFSNILFPVSLRALVEIAPDDAFVYFDSSQLLGLMADPSFFNALREGTVVTGGSTHKTFPGPQKGVFISNDVVSMQRIGKLSDSFVSNNHLNSVAALAITAAEMIQFGKEYSRAVRENARVLAMHLNDLDVSVLGRDREFTQTHQVWIAPKHGEDTSETVARLKESSIIVNSARLPSLNGRRGVRLGTTEVTRLGMDAEEMEQVAVLFADAYHNRLTASQGKARAAELRACYKRIRYCFDSHFDARLSVPGFC